MSLIKLSGVPHPDLNGGKAQPVFIDASRVLLISGGYQQHPKIGAIELKREVYDDLYSGIQRLTKMIQDKTPAEIDTQQTAAWAKDMHMLAHELQDAYGAWARAYRTEDYYPRLDCTEVHLACGTALEQGVMLTRVWVTESPEHVYSLVEQGR